MANNNDKSVNSNAESPRNTGLDQSLVGKFVSNIISTTPFSKWFAKDTTKTPGEVRRRDDYDDDDPACLLQPTKRAKSSHHQHSSLSVNLFEAPQHAATNSRARLDPKAFEKFPEPIAGPSGVSKRLIEEEPHSANGRDDSDSSEEIELEYAKSKRVERKESRESLNSADGKFSSKPRSLFTSSTDLSQSRSLFAPKSSKPPSSLSSRRPNFNASTFGSNSLVGGSLSTKRILSSPFYTGSTVYGGASAYGRHFGRTSASDSLPHKPISRSNSIQIRPNNTIKSASEGVTLSKTARRILNTLEQYSTPIGDAKKVPFSPKREGILSKFVPGTPYSLRDRKRPPNRELQIPELLQMKQKERLQDSTVAVRQIATRSKLSQEEYTLRSDKDDVKSTKSTNKMKSSVSGTLRPKNTTIERELPPINLPKVALDIKELPKFELALLPIPQAKKSEVKPTIVSQTAEITEIVESKASETVTKINSLYSFAKPMIITENLPNLTPINCFNFTKPILLNAEIKTQEINFNMPENKTILVKKSPVKINGENLIKPAEKLTTGSVMDILGKKSTGSTLFAANQATWECPTCLVVNGEERSACAACDETKPSAASDDKNKCSSSGGGDLFKLKSDDKMADNTIFGGKMPLAAFKPSSDTWECQTCLIRNKNTLDKCEACETVRNATTIAPKKGFGAKFAPKSDTWECDVCMIRNKNELKACAACETTKPGEKAMIAGVKLDNVGPKFNFGIPAPTSTCKTCYKVHTTDLKDCSIDIMNETKGFEGFKKRKDEWECDSCMVRNKADATNCVCCGGSKIGFITNDKIETNEPKPKINSFNFGIQSTSGFQFGIPKTEDKTTVVPVEKEVITKKAPEIETKAATFKFGVEKAPETPKKSVEKPIQFKATTTPINGDLNTQNMFAFGKNATPSLNLAPKDAVAPTFSFGKVENKPIEALAPKTFSFGTTTTTKTPEAKLPEKADLSSSTMFKFGASPGIKRGFEEAQSGVNGMESAPKMATFGSTSSVETSKASFSFNDAPKVANSAPFSFAPPAPAQGQNSGFSFAGGASNVVGTSGGFSFGEKKETVQQLTTPTFGGNATSNLFGSGGGSAAVGGGGNGGANGSFNFGGSAINNNQKAIFSFGASQTNNGFNNNSAVVPQQVPQGANFSFGSTNTTAPALGGFNFSGPPPSFNFSDGAATAQPQRKFKKAIRRTTPR